MPAWSDGAIDPPFYTEDELDALYERDPVEAMRLSRRQAMIQRELESQALAAADGPPPSAREVAEVLEKARRVLLRDGGDLELVDVSGDTVRVRLKGNCVGCPRSVIDLKNVVERTVRQRFPQIRRVVNTF
jgi:toxin CptA